MTTETSALQVTAQPTVDIGRTNAQEAAGVIAEPSMEEYAEARHEAIKSGKSIQSVLKDKAAVNENVEPAAATDNPAAATGETVVNDPTASESANEDPISQIADDHVAKKGVTKRFGELTAQREAAKAEAAAAKAEAEAARAELEQLRTEAEAARKAAEAVIVPLVPKAEDDPVPNREAFDDPDTYAAAIAAHAAREAIREGNRAAEAAQAERNEAARKATEQAQQAQIQSRITELHKNFNERVEKAQAEYPDFSEKVTNNEKLILRNDVFFAIEQAELAPHVLYHLANHPDVAANLNTLSPYDAAIRIGELQAELKFARKPQVSKAAEPVRPVGQRTSPEPKTPDEMSMEEYAAMREAELTQARTRKKDGRAIS